MRNKKYGGIVPRQYQEQISNQVVGLLMNHGLAYLAMQVRTGKTITSLLAVHKYFVNNYLYKQGYSVLFVTKKKAIGSIYADYESMGGYEELGFKIEVINYESLHKLQTPTGEFVIVIVDEAHNLGTFPRASKKAKALRAIARRKRVIFLSATPHSESLSQLFHQFWISDASPWSQFASSKYAFYRWADEYVDKRTLKVYGREVTMYDKARVDKVEQDVKHLFITLTQEQAGFEGTVEEQHIYVPMPAHLKDLYVQMENDLVFEMEGQEYIIESTVELMTKLHQLTGGTLITKDDAEDRDYHIIDDFKARFIKQQFAGRKIAIFYNYISEGNMLRSIFRNYTDIPEDFEANEDATFIAHLKSGGEGVKLSTADDIVFFNINFSAKDYWQARSRSQYLERKVAPVTYVLTDDSMHRHILKTVQKKKDFTKRVYERVKNVPQT